MPQARDSSPTFHKCEAIFGEMDVSEARRLKALEEENGRLKPMLAGAMLDNVALKDRLGKRVTPAAHRKLPRTCSRPTG